jgi:hypothetical protein
MTTSPEFTDVFYAALSSVTEFKKPRTNMVEFAKIFKSSVGDPDAAALIQQVNYTK